VWLQLYLGLWYSLISILIFVFLRHISETLHNFKVTRFRMHRTMPRNNHWRITNRILALAWLLFLSLRTHYRRIRWGSMSRLPWLLAVTVGRNRVLSSLCDFDLVVEWLLWLRHYCLLVEEVTLVCEAHDLPWLLALATAFTWRDEGITAVRLHQEEILLVWQLMIP